MDQVRTLDFSRMVRIIHAALTTGVAIVGAVFFLLVRARGGTMVAPMVGVVLSVVSIGLLVAAATILRRRIPERPADQSPTTFWAAGETRGSALVLWAVTEGAAVVGWVGYFLTGSVVPAAIAGLAFGMLVMLNPARLEGAD
jgi:hypothetical protein